MSTQHRNSTMAKEFTAGATVKELSLKYTLTPNRVRVLLTEQGVYKKKEYKSHKLSQETKDKIEELYLQGVIIKEIASSLEVSVSSVDKVVADAGISNRITPEELLEEALRLYSDTDMKVADILKQVGISKATFYRYLKKKTAD